MKGKVQISLIGSLLKKQAKAAFKYAIVSDFACFTGMLHDYMKNTKTHLCDFVILMNEPRVNFVSLNKMF